MRIGHDYIHTIIIPSDQRTTSLSEGKIGQYNWRLGWNHPNIGEPFNLVQSQRSECDSCWLDLHVCWWNPPMIFFCGNVSMNPSNPYLDKPWSGKFRFTIYIHLHVHTYTYIYFYTYIHCVALRCIALHYITYIHTYVHINIKYDIYIYRYIHIHIYIYIYCTYTRRNIHIAYTCIYIYIYTYIHIII